jgi:hypothetical protein
MGIQRPKRQVQCFKPMNSLHSVSLSQQSLAYIYLKNRKVHEQNRGWPSSSQMNQASHVTGKHHRLTPESFLLTETMKQ